MTIHPQVLQHINASHSFGASLILLSDGYENTAPLIQDTLDAIDNAGVIIHTIAIGNADQQLEDLAERTGGLSSACMDGRTDGAECVMTALTETVTHRSESVSDPTPIQVLIHKEGFLCTGASIYIFFWIGGQE